MSNNFHFPPHDTSPDHHNNEFLFPNNGSLDNTGYSVPGASDPAGGEWPAQHGLYTPHPDTFAWSDSSTLNQQHHHSEYRQPLPASAEHQQTPNAQSPANGAPSASSIVNSYISPADLSIHGGAPPPLQQPRNTIAPEALQSRSPVGKVPVAANAAAAQAQASQQLRSLSALIPKGSPSGNFLVFGLDKLQKQIPSRDINRFLSVGSDPVSLPTHSTNIPAYFPRKSRAQINRLLANNKNLNTSLSKKPPKKAGTVKPISRAARLNASGKPSGPLSKDDSESDESTDESEYESEDEDDEPPIPTERPGGLQAATRWDTIKALWRPSSKPVPAESIREALKVFWEDVKPIRERWKSDQDNVDKAEEEKKVKDLPILRERAKSQRDLLEVTMNAAVQHGHPDILANVGRTKPIMQILNAFLRDRNKAADHNGGLSVAILEFLSRCGTIDSQEMSSFGMDKVLQRFSTRGDATVKAIVKRVLNNFGTAASKKGTASSAKAALEPTKRDTTSVNGAKKTLPADANNSQPVKSIAREDSPRGKTPAVLKKPVTNVSKAAVVGSSTTAPPKTKTNQIYAKPSSFISSLQSAKKPGATSAAAPKPAPEKKPVEKKGPPLPSVASSFSFASVLADVNAPAKPKKVEKKVEEDKAPLNETSEERTKRLRKEQRRKLRVSWAPEESLTHVKYFEHDPNEELGHDAAQTRHVGDTKSESVMFKHMRGTTLDIEDDEEDAFIRSWQEPGPIDFSDLIDYAKEQNFIRYGGNQKPASPETIANESYEANTLVVVYADDADIPPSPKEPTASEDEPEPERKEFGPLPEHVTTRIAEIKKAKEASKALSADITSLLGNLAGLQAPPAPSQAPIMGGSGLDLSALLGSAAPAPNAQMFAQFAPQSQPASSVVPTPDVSSILAALNNNPTPRPPQPVHQNYHLPSAPKSIGGQDIDSILAALNSGQGKPQQSRQAFGEIPAYMGNQGWLPQAAPPAQTPQMGQAWNGAFGLMAAAQQQPGAGPAGSVYENADRKRMREEGTGEDSEQLFKKRATELPYKTIQCKYWHEGKCRKGTDCTFKHGED